MQQVKLQTETLNIILNYLAHQPFKEVVEIINAIQSDLQNPVTGEEPISAE